MTADNNLRARARSFVATDSVPAGSDDPPPPTPTFITADALLATRFTEPRWAVPGLIPDGLSILAGSPKTGKSWAALNIALAVASGGVALGRVPVPAGDVLVVALEDNPRRLQERLVVLLQGDPAPARLTLTTAFPTLDHGAIAHLSGWLTTHREARLVVIDTLERIRGDQGGARTRNAYAADYAAAAELKQLADRHEVALLVVHHVRKATADDPLDLISGTNGLAGGVDTALVLKRQAGRADAVLYVRGRDVAEAEHALGFDAATCAWTMLGAASDYRRSEERQEVLDLLARMAPEALTPKQVAEALDRKVGAVRVLLHRMHQAGEVAHTGRGYTSSLFISNGNESNGVMRNASNAGNEGESVTGTMRDSNALSNAFEGRNPRNHGGFGQSVTGVTALQQMHDEPPLFTDPALYGLEDLAVCLDCGGLLPPGSRYRCPACVARITAGVSP